MANFKKGDKVHFIRGHHTTSKYWIDALTVYSCGKKQMVLVDAAGKKFAGMAFLPTEIQQTMRCAGSEVVTGIVLAGLTDEQAEAKALEMSAVLKPHLIRDCNERIQKHSDSVGYVAAVRRDIATLEAEVPSFDWLGR